MRLPGDRPARRAWLLLAGLLSSSAPTGSRPQAVTGLRHNATASPDSCCCTRYLPCHNPIPPHPTPTPWACGIATATPARLRERQQLHAALRVAAQGAQALQQHALGIGLGQAERGGEGRVQRAQRGQRHVPAPAAAAHHVDCLARAQASRTVSPPNRHHAPRVTKLKVCL